MMRKVRLLLLAWSLSVSAFCGTKRALTVFIGDYPSESGWNRLASGNDRTLILGMLDRLGFERDNIDCLLDEAATYDAILNTMDNLILKAEAGDQIYVHFSCHGQQITDQNGDEVLANPKDRYDESIVPYDANVAYGWNGYKGDHHMRDDVLNNYFARLQKAVGRKGYVLVIYDACHSGDMDRISDDGETYPYRGTFDAFEQPYTGNGIATPNESVSWMSISACKDFQTNFEVEINGQRFGRLSYAIGQCLRGGMTYETLITDLQDLYRSLPMPPGKLQTIQHHAPDKMNKKQLFTNEG